jgi:predicted site-specific integrase-resolvase
MQENRLLNPKEIMQRYGISRTTLRKWIRNFSLPAWIIPHSNRKYAYETDVIAWEKNLKPILPTTQSPDHQSLS